MPFLKPQMSGMESSDDDIVDIYLVQVTMKKNSVVLILPLLQTGKTMMREANLVNITQWIHAQYLTVII